MFATSSLYVLLVILLLLCVIIDESVCAKPGIDTRDNREAEYVLARDGIRLSSRTSQVHPTDTRGMSCVVGKRTVRRTQLTFLSLDTSPVLS